MDEETLAEMQKVHRMLGGLQARITVLEKSHGANLHNHSVLQEQVIAISRNLSDTIKTIKLLTETLKT